MMLLSTVAYSRQPSVFICSLFFLCNLKATIGFPAYLENSMQIRLKTTHCSFQENMGLHVAEPEWSFLFHVFSWLLVKYIPYTVKWFGCVVLVAVVVASYLELGPGMGCSGLELFKLHTPRFVFIFQLVVFRPTWHWVTSIYNTCF